MTAVYVCDRKRCEDCNPLCKHTSDIQHAVNFDKHNDMYIERTEASMSFGEALEALKAGKKVRRRGWNGKGIYIELQRPDEHSKMTLPYIYIVTNGLVTDNPDAPKGVVPWLASQTDMLSEDWEVA